MGGTHTSRGISLLEVIIAFAITSILVAATMPNYQDYTVRARVNEGLRMALPAQDSLVRACRRDGQAIINENRDAGYVYRSSTPERDFVDHVVLAGDCKKRDLVVMVWLYNTGGEQDPVIEWTAKVPSGVLAEGFETPYYWNCRIIRGDFAHVPRECRKRYRKS